jgi:hypothetical protein
VPISRVLRDVVGSDDALAVEGGRKNGRVGIGKPAKSSRDAPDSVYRV